MNWSQAAQQMRARFGWLGPAPGRGGPGGGETSDRRAGPLAGRHPVLVVRSDELRKALFRQPTYSSDESGAVYLTGYALLESLLRDGYAVVFDATNLLKSGRRRARAVATGAGAPCLTIVTVAPPEVVAARLSRRASGGAESFSSDAGWTVYERLAGSAEPAGEIEEEPFMVDTSRDISPALAAVDRFLAGSASAAGRQDGAPEAFNARLDAAMIGRDSLLCVGLDPEPEKLPEALRRLPPAEAVLAFNREIIAATSDLVVAYKPNLAFYEALGPAGLEALRETVRLIPSGVLAIGDAKRGDIANTMRLYAKALFEVYGFDAVTASPYLGRDALAPFLDHAARGVFVLCRTSNPGAAEIVELDVAGKPLYRRVAERAREWNEKGNLGLVVGATVPHELAMVREDCPSLPILLPGIGAQGGDLSQAVAAGLNGAGTGLLVVAARQVLYASSGSEFPAAARQVALSLREQINQVRLARQGAPRQ
jgi:orotidine-5'-phosphate decarboxylase